MVRSETAEYLFQRFLLAGICFFISYPVTESIADPEVTIIQGSLRGAIWTTDRGRNVSAFLGIPFAQPPIGNLRFANPVAADGWSGIRNATVVRSSCPQNWQYDETDEDCLHLAVYTPQLPENGNSSLLIPVMVFIHGGGFVAGSSSPTWVNPFYLLEEDIVLVGIQYRLGPLGFLSTGDAVASGNWGLKDQILALEWVKNNVEYFGGDPNRVTIFGESAGAMSVHLLTLSDATDGLFHKYITQSGSALSLYSYRPSASYAKLAFELGEHVGCSNESSLALIACLRTVNASDITVASSQLAVWQRHGSIVWGPTDEPDDIEGAVLTDSPANLFAAGKVRDLPWISGVCRDEGLIYTEELYGNEELLTELLDNFESILPQMLGWTYQSDSGAAWVDAVKSYYFENDFTGNRSVILTQLTRLVGDALFNYPAHTESQQYLAVAKNPHYFYSFNYKGTGSSEHGVAHANDLVYLFELTNTPILNFNMSQTDMEMVEIMVQLWTSFATNGTPITSAMNNTGNWEPYSSQDNYLRIGNESEVDLETKYSFLEERMQFWADLEASSQTVGGASNALYYSTTVLFLASLSLLVVSV